MTSTGILRVEPPLAADEVTTLRAFLDHQRDTLRWKAAGLTAEQLDARHPPATMTLGPGKPPRGRGALQPALDPAAHDRGVRPAQTATPT
jgi:hypothetical protein